MSERQSVKNRIRDIEREYLAQAGGLGIDPGGLQDLVDKDRQDYPEKYTGSLDEMVHNMVVSVYGETPKELPLFKIAGVTLTESITVPDRSTPSGFRKVETYSATANQARECAILKMRKGAEVLAKAESYHKVADLAFERGDGNPETLLRDVLDK